LLLLQLWKEGLMNRRTFVLAVVLTLALAGTLWAGNPESSTPPETTFSLNLEDLFLRLTTGDAGTPSAFTEPSVAPGTGTMYTIDQIMAVAPAVDETFGATHGEVVAGRTFWGLTSGEWGPQTGTRDPCIADADNDGTPDCFDQCPNHPDKTSPGACGCAQADTDADGDGIPVCFDGCQNDPGKLCSGQCGCGTADTDSDGDTVADCLEECDSDPNKLQPGPCGCGAADTDSDGDGSPDCIDGCDFDPRKTTPLYCGCGNPETGDSDGDGFMDCRDWCPTQGVPTIGSRCWWSLTECVRLDSYTDDGNGCYTRYYSSDSGCTVFDPPC
jgi:hypothetical protein